jgi:hypothetical protein
VLRSDRSGAVSLNIDPTGITLKQACDTPRYWSSQRCHPSMPDTAEGQE